MIASLIARLALGTGLPKTAIKIIGAIALAGLAYLAFNLWLSGQRHDAVSADRAAANIEAANALANATTDAFIAADEREESFVNKQELDKKGIEDAQRNGSSPLDALFPSR